MDSWLRLDTDRGAVLWAVLCCWLAVLANFALIRAAVPIGYIVPLDLFGIPLVVSIVFWLLQRWAA